MIKIYNWSNTPQKIKQKIMRRCQNNMPKIYGKVKNILSDVKQNGDLAIVKYTKKFDNPLFKFNQIKVTKKDIVKAFLAVDPKIIEIIKQQITISKNYAKAEKTNLNWDWKIKAVNGVTTGLRLTPIESVGLYVPAGKAPLPVVAQILAVTAKVAGCSRIVVCFPPTTKNNEIIVSAILAGATEIYRVGGAQAIAALAYGTKTIKPVNFIAGPGNTFVQAAKLQVFGRVGIDMFSGPSEALIIADKFATPKFLAADVLARCEHGSDSAGVIVTTSKKIAQQTLAEIKRQAPLLKRQKYIRNALKTFSAIILVKSKKQMINFANSYSPEHLEVQTKDAQELLPLLKNAGSIFLGNYAPVAVGDYASGTNHCLPTGVAPKFASAVGVRMFLKASGYQYLTQQGLFKLKPIVETLSDVEGLDAHKKSVQIRFEK